MKKIEFAEAHKGRTLHGLPCLVIERRVENKHGEPSELEVVAEFTDDGLGHATLDGLLDRLNAGKIKL